MAAPATDFIPPWSYSFTGATTVKDYIIALYNLIQANSLSYVTITDYSATEAHIELKTSGQSAQRILIFGGQVPHTDAIKDNSLSASYLYILVAPDADTTGPDQSYTLGNPYNVSGTYNTLGVAIGSYFASYNIARLFECSDGIGFFVSAGTATSFGGGFGGGLMLSPDKETIRFCASGGGGGAWNATWASLTSGVSGVQVEEAPSTSDAVCSCLIENYGSAINAYRCERIISANALKDTDGQGVLIPVVMASGEGNVSPGTLRGVYMGPRATFGATVNGSQGWAMAGADETDALYFANI